LEMQEWFRARRVQVVEEGESGKLEGDGRMSNAGLMSGFYKPQLHPPPTSRILGKWTGHTADAAFRFSMIIDN